MFNGKRSVLKESINIDNIVFPIASDEDTAAILDEDDDMVKDHKVVKKDTKFFWDNDLLPDEIKKDTEAISKDEAEIEKRYIEYRIKKAAGFSGGV